MTLYEWGVLIFFSLAIIVLIVGCIIAMSDPNP